MTDIKYEDGNTVYHSFVFASPAEEEDFEERAAIMEYMADLPRDEAEKKAYALIVKERKKR